MSILVPVLAGIGALCMSNPGRRRRKSRRRNPRSGARDPHEYELGSYLFKEFKGLKKQGVFGTPEGASHLCRLFNAATAPNLFRTDEDNRTCGRVAMLCRRIRTNHYGSRSIQETADGAWYPVRRNPAKRRKGKRKGKWVSPTSAASRLAWWRWHSNPGGMRDLTTHNIRRGDVDVIIAQWRNRNATAFIAVSASGPGGVKTWEAKSQGPSAGGYSKPTQAAERVYHKITGRHPSWGGHGTREMNAIASAAAEQVGGPADDWMTRNNPRRRHKSRRR